MRRALASLLLVLWVAGLCAPLVAQPNLPICCRIDGKHHCAMHLPGDGFRAALCPLYQHAPPTLSTTRVAAMTVQARLIALHSICQAQLPLHSPDVSRWLAGDVQKRGPPLA